jgi:hypothetical protein
MVEIRIRPDYESSTESTQRLHLGLIGKRVQPLGSLFKAMPTGGGGDDLHSMIENALVVLDP